MLIITYNKFGCHFSFGSHLENIPCILLCIFLKALMHFSTKFHIYYGFSTNLEWLKGYFTCYKVGILNMAAILKIWHFFKYLIIWIEILITLVLRGIFTSNSTLKIYLQYSVSIWNMYVSRVDYYIWLIWQPFFLWQPSWKYVCQYNSSDINC